MTRGRRKKISLAVTVGFENLVCAVESLTWVYCLKVAVAVVGSL